MEIGAQGGDYWEGQVKAQIEIIRENYFGEHFKQAVCKRVDMAKEDAIAPLAITWLIDAKGLLIAVIEWCEH
jgi:hypothetical protein